DACRPCRAPQDRRAGLPADRARSAHEAVGVAAHTHQGLGRTPPPPVQGAVRTTFRSQRESLLAFLAVLVAATITATTAAASAPRGPAAGPFDGRWHTTLTRAQLVRA